MHGRILAGMAAVALSISSIACGDSIFINEFHYDDPGSRDGNEIVELAISTGMSRDGIRFYLYSGASGNFYSSADVSAFEPGATVGDFTLYTMNFTGTVRDGPDGMALVDGTTVLEFLSYEGTITATAGPAAGMTSIDVGVAETGLVDGTSIGRTGSGNDASDFTWALFANDTPGQINTGQTFTSLDVAVAPLPLAGLAGLGLVAGLGMTRRPARDRIP